MNNASQLIDIMEQDLAVIPEFQPDDWPDIATAFAFYLKSWFCKPMKLMKRDEIVGIGNIIFLHDTAWLSQIIIREDYRSQGLGSVLTQGLIDQCKSKVRCVSLLATDLGFPVYQKLGFVTQGVYHFYKGSVLDAKGDSGNITGYDTLSHCDILELDKAVSREIRSRLLQEHLSNAKVIKNRGEVIAYYLPTLGEGQIFSRDIDAGLALIQYHLRDKDKIVFPEENISAGEMLMANGYNHYRSARRMYIGDPAEYKREWIYSRIGGNLG